MPNNVTKAQAERYFKAFCKANNVDPAESYGPQLVEDFDGYRWSIYWDFAEFYGDFGMKTERPTVDYLWTELVNSQRIALYPL